MTKYHHKIQKIKNPKQGFAISKIARIALYLLPNNEYLKHDRLLYGCSFPSAIRNSSFYRAIMFQIASISHRSAEQSLAFHEKETQIFYKYIIIWGVEIYVGYRFQWLWILSFLSETRKSFPFSVQCVQTATLAHMHERWQKKTFKRKTKKKQIYNEERKNGMKWGRVIFNSCCWVQLCIEKE